ncbi:hypothetical protein KOR42_54580 [Thalassoglobus neptunius]|uniref:Uncharacterized protein n=1 Tax=Thalassoglobus neptunius TaxID=1938619 RepID=A0A5C5UXH5_9PLAN|nr:hypothetical protein [Thalassoglobus neptunius]TWT30519.1 hypothetical protein KOR42_54580 [Thalassoglobus neptunius]
MPTGYTDGVQSGKITEFNEYAILCARAFGATIMMRDDPLDAEIPEFEPSTFYRDKLEQATKELAEFESMTSEQRRTMHEQEHAEKVATAETYISERNEQRQRYEAMLEKAKAFTPPTAEHEGLAKFMVEQLEQSIEHDCGSDYWENEKVKTPFDEWEKQRLESLRDKIGRYAGEWQGEQTRTEGRNRWVRELRKELETGETLSV